MKNLRLTISISVLGILLISMIGFVYHSKALTTDKQNLLNPYDDPSLSTDDVITLYHTNMNTAFNNYIKMMMDPSKPTTPPPGSNGTPGSSYHQDGSPFSTAECFAHPENYSTFCVAANLLGADSDECSQVGKMNLSDGMDTNSNPTGLGQPFCYLDKGSLPLQGYFNFIAALKKREQGIFDTVQQQQAYSATQQTILKAMTAPANVMSGAGSSVKSFGQGLSTLPLIGSVVGLVVQRQTDITAAMDTAKKALDTTLSAYDQLGTAWPMHLKYIDVYNALVQYRDKLVDLRHQTDLFPKTFIDLTTTACL